MGNTGFVGRLKQRKVVEWTLAYLAGAWVVFEATGTAADVWGTPAVLLRSIHVLLFMGFFAAVILAWFHGEKGRQRLGRLEVMELVVVLVVSGGILDWVGRRSTSLSSEDPAGGVRAMEGAAFLDELSARPGLMVLPFENRSGLQDDQYFVDGMYDELLTRLERARGLRVISRTTCELYRGSGKPTGEIAAENSVGYLLEGSVQRAGGRVRINVQLIEAATDDHIWAESYERELTVGNLFEIQSGVVEAVARELTGTVIDQEQSRAFRASTTSSEAYDLFLRAGQAETLEQRVALLSEAVRLDPDFAAAHAMLARRAGREYRAGSRDPRYAEITRVSAERALALEPEWPETYLAMATYYSAVEGDRDRALEWWTRAQNDLRGSAAYNERRGAYERQRGLWEAAVESFAAATILSPGYANAWQNLGQTYVFMRRYDEGEATFARFHELSDRWGRWGLAQLKWFRDGDLSEYRSPAIERTTNGGIRSYLIHATISDRRLEDAWRLVEDSEEELPMENWLYPKPLLEAWVLEAQGETDLARERYLETIEILRAAQREPPEDERLNASLGLALAGVGRYPEADSSAQIALEDYQIEQRAVGAIQPRFLVAAIYVRTGHKEEALELLEEILSVPGPASPQYLETHHLLWPLHDDPDFQALMDRERDRVF